MTTQIKEAHYFLNSTADYKLWLNIGCDGISLVVTNMARHVLYWHSTPFEARVSPQQLHRKVQAWAADQAVLQRHFADIHIAVYFPQTILVPDAWFEPYHARTYLTRTIGDDLIDMVARSEHAAAYDLHLVYGLPQPLLHTLNTLFPNAKVRHSFTKLLSGIQYMARAQRGTFVYALTHTNALTLIVADSEKLYLMNTYAYLSARDYLYYVMLVYQELGLDTAVVPLVMAGDIVSDSEIVKMMSPYIGSISWAQRPSGVIVGEAAKYSMPAHFHNELLYQIVG